MNNLLKPLTKYIPVIDKLYIQVKRAFIQNLPEEMIFFPTHTDVNLFMVNRRNAKDEYHSDAYQLIRTKKCHNNQYHLQYDIVISNKLLGSIFLDAVKGYETQSDMLPVQLSNQILYDAYIPLLTGFLKAFDLYVHRYTQVDVAIDTNTNLQDKFLHYYERENTFHFVQGKKMLSDIGTAGKRYRDGKRSETFYIGSPKSDTQTAIYNKSLDIAAKGKDYITQYHSNNGLDTSIPVHRSEVHIHGDALATTETAYATENGEILSKHQYEACLKANNHHRQKATRISKNKKYPIDYMMFDDPVYLVTLFSDFHGIKFRKKDASRVTNCTPIDFFDFTIYSKTSMTMKPTPFYAETKNNDFRNEKKMLKECVVRFKESGKLHHLEYAAELASENNLTGILNQILMEFNTEYTIKSNALQRCVEELVLDNHLHLLY